MQRDRIEQTLAVLEALETSAYGLTNIMGVASLGFSTAKEILAGLSARNFISENEEGRYFLTEKGRRFLQRLHAHLAEKKQVMEAIA